MLATTKLETGDTFEPIGEKGGKAYLEGMYDPILGKDANRRKMAISNGNDKEGDGVKYKGRGFVQLTWKDNYKKMADKFNVDLVESPDLAMDFDIAVNVMIHGMELGIFTGKKLNNYINDEKTDYRNARRIINGLDKAEEIEGFAKKIEKCLMFKSCSC